MEEDFDILDENIINDPRFPNSKYVPPILDLSVYKNVDGDLMSTSGFPIIHFISQDETQNPWYHNGINRDGANKILKSKREGTFIVRPSSHPQCLACSYVDNNNKVVHEMVHSIYPGYSKKEKPLKNEIFSTLSELVSKSDYLKLPLESNQVSIKQKKQSIKQTSLELVSKIVDLLDENEKEFTVLEWKLKQTKISNLHTENNTIVCYCSINYIAPDLLPLQGIIGKDIFEAIEENTTVKKIISNSADYHIVNITDEEIKIFALSLRKNKTIKYINFESNQITDIGAIEIVKSLARNQTVTYLNIGKNFIHARGLRAIAQLLMVNTYIDSLLVHNQYIYDIKGYKLHSNYYCLFLCNMIKSSLERKKEILSNSYFKGFLTKDNVDKYLRNHQTGSYIFYLQRNVANCIFLACVVPISNRNIILHIPVYRSSFGYTTDIKLYKIPSLLDTCMWSLCSTNNFPNISSLQRKIDKAKKLHMLWGILEIPSERPTLDNIYLTLKHMINNLKSVIENYLLSQFNKHK